MSAFDDAALLRDYHFLEHATRSVDGAERRLRSAAPSEPKAHATQTPAQRELHREARRRGVLLELLPCGMQRQRENTSHFDRRSRVLRWRVELCFARAGVRHAEEGVPEETSVADLLRSVLLPDRPLDGTGEAAGRPPVNEAQRAVLRHRLREYLGEHGRGGADACEGLVVLMRAERRAANDPRYHALALDESVGDALRGRVVLEFPTLHVATRDEADRFPRLDEAVPPVPA